MVEYATPVLSLYEMSNSEEAGLSSHERLQQMNTFVSTLTGIIHSNPETKNYCSLVVYDGKSNSFSNQPHSRSVTNIIARYLLSFIPSLIFLKSGFLCKPPFPYCTVVNQRTVIYMYN